MTQSASSDNNHSAQEDSKCGDTLTRSGSAPFPYAHTGSNSKSPLDIAIELGVLDNPANRLESTRRPNTVLAIDNNNHSLENTTMTTNNTNNTDLANVLAAMMAQMQQLAASQQALATATTTTAPTKSAGPFCPKSIDVYACVKKNTDGSLSSELNGNIAIKLGPKSSVSLAPEVWLKVLKPFEDGTVREMVEECFKTKKPQKWEF